LETGKGEGVDNETIWFVYRYLFGLVCSAETQVGRNVPLRLLSVDASGKAVLDKEALLTEREQFFKIDTSKPYKLNAGTSGVCEWLVRFVSFWVELIGHVRTDRVLYEPKTLTKIAEEGAKENSVFSLNDRMGLVYDTVALSKAGLADVSSALTLIDILGKKEKECELLFGYNSDIGVVTLDRSCLGGYC
jgi:aminopeptidase 2